MRIYRFCTKSKKMFSSRAMLDKHVQLRHSMEAQSHDTLTVRYNAFLASSLTEKLSLFFLLLFFLACISCKIFIVALQSGL